MLDARRAAQDSLDEMSSNASNVLFLFMWPVFNVLLVRGYRGSLRLRAPPHSAIVLNGFVILLKSE